MLLASEEIKSSLSHKVETRNKSIVELENIVNELRMKNIQQNNKVCCSSICVLSVLRFCSKIRFCRKNPQHYVMMPKIYNKDFNYLNVQVVT